MYGESTKIGFYFVAQGGFELVKPCLSLLMELLLSHRHKLNSLVS